MKKPAPQQGLSLERFAHAKTSSYDKKKAKEKEFALNAKKVNKYRKLKQRLAKAGKLRPLSNTLEQVQFTRKVGQCCPPKSSTSALVSSKQTNFLQVFEGEELPARKVSKFMESDSSPQSPAKAGFDLDRILSRWVPSV